MSKSGFSRNRGNRAARLCLVILLILLLIVFGIMLFLPELAYYLLSNLLGGRALLVTSTCLYAVVVLVCVAFIWMLKKK